MAAPAAGDDPAVAEILALLSDLPVLISVPIQGPGTHGGITIIVRKTAQQRGGRTQYHYAWEARGGPAGHAWEQAGGPTYQSAATAYQAAVEAVQVVQAVLRDQAT